FGMNSRAPEALVGVDVADAAQGSLVEQERLDSRFMRFEKSDELLLGNFKWIGTKTTEFRRQIFRGKESHATEATGIGVAEFAAIIEQEPDVGVLRRRL